MTPVGGGELFALVVLAVLLAWDQNAGLHLQISQPLVAGALGGALVGNFEGGVAAGALVQMIWFALQPVGGARLPDLASAGLVAGVCAPSDITLATTAWLDDGRLTACAVVAVVVAYAGGSLLVTQRHVQEKLATPLAAAIDSGDLRGVAAMHRQGLGLHALRAGIVTLIAMASVPYLVDALNHLTTGIPGGRLALGFASVRVLRVAAIGKRRFWLAGLVAGALIGLVQL